MDNVRIAWLMPSLERGFYWQPVLSEFSRLFPQTIVFTGVWPGFSPTFKGRFVVKVVGKTKAMGKTRIMTRYSRTLVNASPSIIGHLLHFNPHVIFASAFSIWTILALLLKPWRGWRVVIAYDGSSPNIDCRDSSARLFFRRMMVRFADAFITNSRRGKAYLTEILGAKENRVLAKPYEVSTPSFFLGCLGETSAGKLPLRHPIFLCVGQVIPRKGLHLLLDACVLLQMQGCHDFTLLVVGDGPQREELEVYSKNHCLEHCVKWVGWVDYDGLGTYFQATDIFVFPTLEDIWGLVVLEAMIFGKPVLCSKWAGAAELVVDEENGYVFDPYQTEKLAELMRRFIDDPSLILSMGEKSKEIIASHTPAAAAKSLSDVVRFVLDGNEQYMRSDLIG